MGIVLFFFVFCGVVNPFQVNVSMGLETFISTIIQTATPSEGLNIYYLNGANAFLIPIYPIGFRDSHKSANECERCYFTVNLSIQLSLL